MQYSELQNWKAQEFGYKEEREQTMTCDKYLNSI